MQDESNNQDLIFSIKKKRLKLLMKQYEAASQQLEETLNKIDKLSINEQMKGLEIEIEQLQGEIDNLKLRSHQIDSSKFHSQYSRKWEEEFHKIDFRAINKKLKSILGKFEDREGAALFLLQNSRSRGGDLCIKNIKSQLQDMGNLCSPCEFAFLSHQTVDRIDFLTYLAQEFEIQPCLDEISKTDRIIDKICDSLRSGHIFFVKIDIYNLAFQDPFLDWFLHQFWCKLITRLPQLSQNNPLIRFVAVVSISGSIPKSLLLSDLCCKSNKFDDKKFLELSLEKIWTKPQINNWLLKFSGITAPPIEVTKEEIERMAESIHQVSDGIPANVYNDLKEAMFKRVSQFCKERENYGTKY